MLKKIVHYFETDNGKFQKNAIVCLGASIVLLGALFKLMHWPGASIMLIVGMLTEALLFGFFAILPPHKDYHWEKVYPGLDISPELEHGAGQAHMGSAVEQINKGLQDAEVGPEIIEKLGSNLKKLGDQLAKLSDMSDASVASNKFAQNAESAAQVLEEMKGAYSRATEAVSVLADASTGASTYNEQMQIAAKNLSALNESYQMQLQDTQSFGKAFQNIAEVANTLESAVEDTKKYKESVGELANNIASLNSIYGNMLSAMSNR